MTNFQDLTFKRQKKRFVRSYFQIYLITMNAALGSFFCGYQMSLLNTSFDVVNEKLNLSHS